MPRPRTMRVWNGDQRMRSRRAGMVLRIGCCTSAVAVMPCPFPEGRPREANPL